MSQSQLWECARIGLLRWVKLDADGNDVFELTHAGRILLGGVPEHRKPWERRS